MPDPTDSVCDPVYDPCEEKELSVHVMRELIRNMSVEELYEELLVTLDHESIHRDTLLYLTELYYRDKPTFLPWFDYNRICCDQCYEEIRRNDRFTQDWRCILCAKNQVLPLSESRQQYDELCLTRYLEMTAAMRPLVEEEIRQRNRVRDNLDTLIDLSNDVDILSLPVD